jgi:hypothetical protein
MPRAYSLRTYLNHRRGRATQLAIDCAVSLSLVSLWANKKRQIPIYQCKLLTALTGVPLRLLRPDLVRLIAAFEARQLRRDTREAL